MTIFSLTVGKNEVDRYLASMMKNTVAAVDRSFYFDDWSEDQSRECARQAGAVVFPRESDTPSFVENEGLFRGAAWAAFEKYMQPVDGDWVLVIDCDEFIVSNEPDYSIDDILKLVASEANGIGAVAFDLSIPEVFGFAYGIPQIRVDGLWGTIHAPRFFAYHLGGQYPPIGFGVPAVPNYVMASKWQQTDLVSILHYGYTREADQVAKHQRYTGHQGHSNAHVESIVSPDKVLISWKGIIPCRP